MQKYFVEALKIPFEDCELEFAYGSGCVAEFFSGIVQKEYAKNLCKRCAFENVAK